MADLLCHRSFFSCKDDTLCVNQHVNKLLRVRNEIEVVSCLENIVSIMQVS